MKKKKEEITPAIIPYDYISNSDCIEGMKAMPSNCVDMIIADPPYNLSKSGDWKWDNSVSLSGMGGKQITGVTPASSSLLSVLLSGNRRGQYWLPMCRCVTGSCVIGCP